MERHEKYTGSSPSDYLSSARIKELMRTHNWAKIRPAAAAWPDMQGRAHHRRACVSTYARTNKTRDTRATAKVNTNDRL